MAASSAESGVATSSSGQYTRSKSASYTAARPGSGSWHRKQSSSLPGCHVNQGVGCVWAYKRPPAALSIAQGTEASVVDPDALRRQQRRCSHKQYLTPPPYSKIRLRRRSLVNSPPRATDSPPPSPTASTLRLRQSARLQSFAISQLYGSAPGHQASSSYGFGVLVFLWSHLQQQVRLRATATHKPANTTSSIWHLTPWRKRQAGGVMHSHSAAAGGIWHVNCAQNRQNQSKSVQNAPELVGISNSELDQVRLHLPRA